MIAPSDWVGPHAAHDAFEPHPTPAVEDCLVGTGFPRTETCAALPDHTDDIRKRSAAVRLGKFTCFAAINSVGQVAVRLFAIVVQYE